MSKSLLLLLLSVSAAFSQLKPTVTLTGGNNVPELRQRITVVLEAVLLETNRIEKGTGNIELLQDFFLPEAFQIFKSYIVQNKAFAARKSYAPMMVERQKGQLFDIRSITMKVQLGGTDASDNQNLIFTFNTEAKITVVKAALPNYDLHSVVSQGKNAEDSLMREFILDFLEQFRMAYNTKNVPFLEKVYSDEALIIVGTLLEEKKDADDFSKSVAISEIKVKLNQQTKMEYIDALKNRAFKNNAFINVRFEDIKILQHPKISWMYAVTCWQKWTSPTYSDKGHMFLMIDFRNRKEPVIHVRVWQPKPYEEDGSFFSFDDFDIVEFK